MGKLGTESAVMEPSDLFVGVEGKEAEGEEFASHDDYFKAVKSSAAYGWFINSFRKECTFQWSKTPTRVMVDNIRQTILGQLPTGRISKRHLPCVHRATFKISWLPFISRLCHGHNGRQATVNWGIRICDLVTITWAAGEAQAATVDEYFKQTWPSGGSTLLSLLQNVFEDTCSLHSSKRAVHPYVHLIPTL